MSGPGRLRVLHVIPEDGLGGVEVAAKSVMDRVDLPCDVRVLFVLRDRGAARTAWRERLGFASARNLGAYRRAFAAMRRNEADVIVFSLWKSVPLLIVARLFLRGRVVYFLHLERAMHRVDGWLSRLAVRLADAVWADSAATLRSRAIPAGKPTRVISFVTERMVPLAHPTPRAAFVSWGRLNVQKGVDRAIRLVALLTERGVDATLSAYGRDDGELAALRALTEQLGVVDRVRFPGPVAPRDRATVAAEAAFFLQLSRSEGMCMAAVEGMQLGLVPVATPVGQMASYVQPGRTGVLVDPNDLPAAADEVIRLLRDPARYRTLSDGARAQWAYAPLYADDLCEAALELVGDAEDRRHPRARGGEGV